MSLTSASTINDALDQYNNNLNWEDTAQAQNALQAVRYILANRPERIASGERSINYPMMEKARQELTEILQSSGTTINRVTFTRARMLT